jgi:glycosyltransferase involved in cell wall biosynthesis
MKVLIVSAYALPHIGGVEVIVAQQARSLAELGCDVTIFTSASGSAVGVHEHGDGYRVVRRRAWNGFEARWGVPFPVFGPGALWKLGRLIRDADVVHVHDATYQSSLVGGLMARLLRRPFRLTQHVAVVDHDNPSVRWLQRSVYRTYGRLLWRWASGITVYNPIVQRFLAEHGVAPDKTTLTYNGIDTLSFRPGNGADIAATKDRYGLSTTKPLVLFVGRLVPKKGVDKLIEASGPEYQIVLVGSGTAPALRPGVVCLGPLEREELVCLYQACDIFAFPAVGEMLTLVMQEAMACGLPVVATREPEYEEYGFDPDGLELVPSEADALRKAFLAILGDGDRILRMRKFSRAVAEERFDWRANARDLLALYSKGDGNMPPPNAAQER